MMIEGYEWLVILYLPIIFWRSNGDYTNKRCADARSRVRLRLEAWKDKAMRILTCGY
jgi:hypothetical protein